MNVYYAAGRPTGDVCAVWLLQKLKSEWGLKFSIFNI